jgi:hypothetical protein
MKGECAMGVDPKNFEFAIAQIDNGFIFEDFAKSYLAQILGYDFVPIGGIKDRGIDGLEHTFHREGRERTVYQISIAKNVEGKLRSSLEKLVRNDIKFDRFCFVSNQVIKDQEKLIDKLFEEYEKPIQIFDARWLSSHINDNQGTINVFHTFVSSYLHDFAKPGKEYVVGDLISDPRLFVFLRQQWDHEQANKQLDEIVADALILFALEDTDPDKGLFRTSAEIKAIIAEKISFDPKTLYHMIDIRLKVLSTKPRKIKHHRDIDAYCLPYDTRLELQNRNLDDSRLHEEFRSRSTEMLRYQLENLGVSVKDSLNLMESAFHKLYYQQGLEFADFILKGQNQEAFEKDLADTIGQVVDESSVVGKKKELVKSALMITIREIVYNGSREQKAFLQKLSNTYLMLFLLQCDPKICMFFTSLASKLNVYVCTSILIPAMSEFFLEPQNRRHWNLLKGAHECGVRLIINETILSELVSHFQMIMNKYEDFYQEDEDIYLSDEIQTLYIDEILIRAYFYAKMRGHINYFRDFVDNFVSPNLENAKTELTEWLREEFGIEYVADASLGIAIDTKEQERLFEVLRKHKSAPPKAQNDTKLILTIYAIRDKGNEAGADSIFGFRTWWLSKDTTTMKAVNLVFKDKYHVSCYMRPDFLYNYISLAPKPAEVRESFKTMFPSLLGVNISYHLPSDITDCIHKIMEEHKTKNKARRSAILKLLAEKLRIDPTSHSRAYVKHYLDEQLKKILD